MMPLVQGKFALLMGAASVGLLGSATPGSAQITYSVFPAQPPAVTQPTNHTTDSRVTLAIRDSTIEFLVNAIARQANLRPLYYNSDPVFAKRINVRITNANTSDAFAVVLQGTGLVAKLTSDGETVMIRAQSRLAPTERTLASGSIVGRVTDSASGAGLGGASVKIDETKLSTVTSDSGNFTFQNVPSGDQVLSSKLFSYRPTERTVTVADSGLTRVRIMMVRVPTILSGVVTTAAGQQRKVEVGNDITSLNVDSIMQVAPISSLTDLLETRVPGLTVLHSSGTPGDPSRLRLRGASSLELNNDPIVIVDGIRVYASQSDSRNMNLAPAKTQTFNVIGQNGQSPTTQGLTGGFTAPSPVDQIDPNSIETIEVLKGPSATAIYGSDAAAGVIVITTKHGRAGPTHWSLALSDGINWLPGSWPTNYYRFGVDTSSKTAVGFDGLCPWYIAQCTTDSIAAFQALNDPRYSVFSHGNNQIASLTVSGGVPTLTYSVTGSGAGNAGYLHLPAVEQQRYHTAYGTTYGDIPQYLVRPDHYTTWGANGSLTALPSSTLRVTLQSSLFNGDQQQSSLNNAISQLEGAYIPNGFQGILIANELNRATDNSTTNTNALSLHWQIAPWLPLDATGGINTIQRTDVGYIPYGINGQFIGSGVTVFNANPNATASSDTTGFYSLGHGKSSDQTLNIGTAIPLRLVTLALGGNVHSGTTSQDFIQTNQLAPGVSVPTQFVNAQGIPQAYTYGATGQSTYGWYVEPQLKIASKFFVSPGFRLDGGSGGTTASSSVGGLNAFPKIDLSYVAVDRQGGRPLWGVLTLLRPRLALGIAGIQPLPQDKLRLFNVGDSTHQSLNLGIHTSSVNTNCAPVKTLDGGTTSVPLACLDLLGNSQLQPENDREIEGGFDATLWRGRLSLTFTKYNKTARNSIFPLPVAASVDGGATIQYNIGEVRNTGTEMTMDAIVLQNRTLSWNVGFNLSNDNNLLVHMSPGLQPICIGGDAATQAQANGTFHVCNGEMIRAGYPLFGIWAQPIASFADINHDGVIEPNEIRLADSSVYVGAPNPKYQFNVTTGLTMFSGRLSVNATLAYQSGLTQDNAGACNSAAFLNLGNTPGTSLATQAAVLAAECNGLFNDFNGSLLGGGTHIGLIQTVNTFRFNDLSINYTVPRAVATWFRAPHMTVALQGSNLALRTNYRGIDPDVNAFSTVRAGDETADLGLVPEPRTWTLRMTLGN